MTKVALINPGTETEFGIHEPLNLGFIAGYLEQHGVTVKIIDQLAGDNVENGIESFKPDIVGVTGTTPMVKYAYQIADYARSKGILTVMGGVHVSILPEEGLKHADIVIQGEGEKAMLEIVEGKIKSGIVKCDYIKNIDEIPIPARHLMNMDFYLSSKDRVAVSHLYFVPPKTKIAAILTTRGCPYRCIFCYNVWRETPVRFHSPRRVMEEIKLLVDKYGIKALFFFDDELFVKKNRLKEICALIKENKFGLIWACQARADSVDIDTLRMVKDAGCRQINFGFESGSQKILNILKNDTVTVEENMRAVELCRKTGIISWGTFMIGNPGETMEDINLTRKFIRRAPLTAAMVHITTPFPGTALWDWCKEKGLIGGDVDWLDFTTSRTSIKACETFSKEDIEKIRTRILLRDIILTGKFDWKGFALTAINHPVKFINRAVRIFGAFFRK